MNLEWRVLKFEESESEFNVALDRAILKEVNDGKSPPTIVFTKWKPTVSLGRSQSYALDVDEEACKRHSVTIVRRDSGGQAVYLDKSYIVFSVIAPTNIVTRDVMRIRESFCNIMRDALHEAHIPAIFHPPDNLIIEKNGHHQTLGNAGQIIAKKAVVAQGSVRYILSDMEIMLDVLKVNGQKLQPYREEIERVLSDVYTHNPRIEKEKIEEAFLTKVIQTYGGQWKRGNLTKSEAEAIPLLRKEQRNQEWLRGRENHPARGVCYFFLNGRNLVPSLQQFLPYNKPSAAADSTMMEETKQYAKSQHG